MSEISQAAIKPLRILLVEDHVDTVRVLAAILTRDGHTVHTASTLAEASALCGAHAMDLIITDIELPDGFAYDLISHGKPCNGVKAIVVSGHGMQEHIDRSREAGFITHLVKPIRLDQLRSAIQLAVAS